MSMMWVRGDRYWHCAAGGCSGELDERERPGCLWCDRHMELKLGERGRWKDIWFWSCPTHRVPNRGLKSEPGPADPGTLHHQKPRYGGGHYRHGI